MTVDTEKDVNENKDLDPDDAIDNDQIDIDSVDEVENEGLDVIEKTLNRMRGDDSYDEPDDLGTSDEAEAAKEGTDDEQKKENEKEGGEAAEAEGLSADAGSEPEKEGAGENEAGVTEFDDDKLRDQMNKATATRFDHFRDTNKELNAKYDAMEGQYGELKRSTDTMNKYINDSEISAEQLSTALTMAKAINSGDFEGARAAFPRMREWMNAVAVGLGDDSAQVQLPEDLKIAVDNLDITPELARKQAVMRQQQGQRQQHRIQAERHQRQTDYDQQQQDRHDDQLHDDSQKAAQSIDTWEREMALKDPDFSVKREKMMSRAEGVMKANPPHLWPQLLRDQYDLISDVMNESSEASRKQSARNQGIRPGAAGGGNRSANEPPPASFEDNFNQTLRGIRGV